ncbi:hypothetical protein CCH79_00006741 [Gambusia affinis]|uniref:Glycosyl transferase family 1 domain-containing protein n=1 Tax=Gambusia affinis TaxID=33528 RepID=A0A315V997_GAMAF|nr:hypothetical protein CCH79_00006741 [Gambusia affinis]
MTKNIPTAILFREEGSRPRRFRKGSTTLSLRGMSMRMSTASNMVSQAAGKVDRNMGCERGGRHAQAKERILTISEKALPSAGFVMKTVRPRTKTRKEIPRHTAGMMSHIESAGHSCELRDVADFHSPSDVAHLVSQNPPFEGALAIHLFKAGRLLLDLRLPFGVIFGGTDINEDVKDEQKRVVMEQRFDAAVGILKFKQDHSSSVQQQQHYSEQKKNSSLIFYLSSYEAFEVSPDSKIYVQPQVALYLMLGRQHLKQQVEKPLREQSHVLSVLSAFILPLSFRALVAQQGAPSHLSACQFLTNLKIEHESWMMRGEGQLHGSSVSASAKVPKHPMLLALRVRTESLDELRVFLLVCGLRRVKDPLYLADVFSEWHSENLHNILIIIGPKVDPALTAEVEAVVKRATGVFLAQERSQQELHAAMKRCFAVVNSSVSEGMSAAILEAMDLRVPVLARNIPGNAAVVKHGVTGLLFSSPQEFVQQSQRLLSDPELRERVVRSGKLYVEEHHSVKRERETYQRLVDKLLKAQCGECWRSSVENVVN